ncbi:MAG: methyl-accepting chemotaxis protein [Campylobacterales bacterium]|nr:methyl-accepting chemotaxis protein [Campylobacterales bacterium]
MATAQSSSFLSRLSIKQKISLIVILTQLFALVAISIGVIGMFLSNTSIQTIHTQSLVPLQQLRTCKNIIEKEITKTAIDLSEGVGDFDKASKIIKISHEHFNTTWELYSNAKLTEQESKNLPEIKESMARASRSITLLEEKIAAKDLMGVLDLIQSDFPYSLAPANEKIDTLIELQITNADHLYALSQAKFKQTLILIAIILPLGMIIVFFILRTITKDLLNKIANITQIAHHLREGNLLHRIDSNGNDELATAAKNMNNSFEELRKIMSDIKYASAHNMTSAEKMRIVSSTIKEKLQSSTTHVSQTYSHIANLQEIVLCSTAAAQDTNHKIDEANTNLTSVTSQISNINGSIQSVALTQQTLSQELNMLASQAKNVKGILEIIGDIADQTNLLALNAAIEAARAGEHGRGFAVVADEVRKLAERTQDSLSQINRTINTIVDAITDTSQKMDKSTTSILSVSHDSNLIQKIIAASSSLISLAASSVHHSNQQLQKLMSGMDFIASNINSLNLITSSNEASIQEIAEVTHNLDQSSADLNQQLQKFRT